MQANDRHITIVIPVFNEQERIAQTLYDVKDFLSTQGYQSDVMIVDDGSSDLTSEVVRVVDFYGSEVKDQSSGILVQNVKNVGKGYSIAKGILMATGDIVAFIDADSSTPINEINKLIDKIDQGYDVVVGSRNLPDSQIESRPWFRLILSKCFNFAANALGLLDVSDSQCGFKAYRTNVAQEVAKRQRTYGFCFDVEHLHVATKLGFKVAEVPVSWRHAEGSTLSLCRDSLLMFADLLRIRWIHRNL